MSKENSGSNRIFYASNAERYGLIAAAILCASVIFLIYSNTFNAPFLFDDELSIVSGRVSGKVGFWPRFGLRYLTHLSFSLNYRLGGVDVTGYHVVNTLIHFINALLVYITVSLTFKTPVMSTGGAAGDAGFWAAVAAALIFAAHPVETQAVTYIVQRFASLATLFYLVSLAAFVKWRLRRASAGHGGSGGSANIFYLIAFASEIAAQLSKEIAVTLPAIIVLYDFIFFDDCKRLSLKRAYLVPFLMIFAVAPVAMLMQGSGMGITERLRGMEVFSDIPPWDYLMTQFRVIVTYLRLMVVPAGQNLDYDYPVFHTFFVPQVFLSFIFLAVLLAAGVFVFIRARAARSPYLILAAFGVFWFFITLTVESSVIPIRDVIFEHRLYLPSIGIIITFVCVMLHFIMKRTASSRFSYAPILLILLTAAPLGIATYKRNAVWGDKITFWKEAVSTSPNKSRPRTNLGIAYAEAGQTEDALRELRAAATLEPAQPLIRMNLGSAYMKMNRPGDAVREFRAAVDLKPRDADYRLSLADALKAQDRMDEAAAELKAAMGIRPDIPGIHNNLGAAYFVLGRSDDAISEFNLSLKLNPDDVEAYYNLGMAHEAKGDLDKAAAYYEKFIALAPAQYSAEAEKVRIKIIGYRR